MSYSLKKNEILRGKKKFQKIFNDGQTLKGSHILCKFCLSPSSNEQRAPHLKAGFVVTKKVHRAVDRNHIKRLLREAYRLNKEILLRHLSKSSKDVEMIFLYTPHSVPANIQESFSDIEKDMKFMLTGVTKRFIERISC